MLLFCRLSAMLHCVVHRHCWLATYSAVQRPTSPPSLDSPACRRRRRRQVHSQNQGTWRHSHEFDARLTSVRPRQLSSTSTVALLLEFLSSTRTFTQALGGLLAGYENSLVLNEYCVFLAIYSKINISVTKCVHVLFQWLLARHAECSIRMSHLFYEHGVRPSVCLLRLWIYDHRVQQKVEIVTWQNNYVGVLATRKLKPNWIVIVSCDLEFYCGRPVHGVRIMWSFALRRHPTVSISRYLSICRASCCVISHLNSQVGDTTTVGRFMYLMYLLWFQKGRFVFLTRS